MQILKRECYSDDAFDYEKIYLDSGTVVLNRHPKQPKRDKDRILREVGALMYDAWRNLIHAEAAEVNGVG